MSEKPNFEGHENRECGEHRTVGSHRAWCFECHEWCYPRSPCKGCELALMRTQINAVLDLCKEMGSGYAEKIEALLEGLSYR